MSYQPGTIWVTRVVDAARAHGPDNVVVASLLTVGAVPVLLTGLFFALAFETLTLRFLASQLLATAVAVLGSIGIWYYDRTVFPRFYERMTELVVDADALASIVEAYDRRFRTRFWYVALPWTGLVVAVVVANRGYFESIGIGVADPAYAVYLAFAVWWGLITGIGFHGALITVRCIRRVGSLRMEIDPLHPDGLGGLSSIGYFAIWTTMLISIGSLTLPLAFTIATRGDSEAIVYVAVLLYVLLIALSFVYPTVYVNRRARSIRDEILEEKRQRIRRLQAAREDPGSREASDVDELTRRLEIQTIREDYRDYQDVNLYPMSVDILFRLLSSILLPLAFALAELYLTDAL